MFNRKKKKIEELEEKAKVLLAANRELYTDLERWEKVNSILHNRLDLAQADLKVCEHNLDVFKKLAKMTRVEVADDILKLGIHLKHIPEDAMVYCMVMRIPGWDLRDEETLIKELQWLVAYHVHKGKQGDPSVQPEKEPEKVFTPRVSRSVVGTALFDDTEHFAKRKSGGDPYGII